MLLVAIDTADEELAMTVLDDVVQRWNAVREYVERNGRDTGDEGIALESQLLAAVGKAFYAAGVVDQHAVERGRRMVKGKLIDEDGAVWLSVPELVDGDTGIVETLVRVPVPNI